MNILFLSQWFPFPADNGSKLRIYHLIKGLSREHTVTLFSFYDPHGPGPDQMAPYLCCADVRLVPWKPYNARSGRATLGFLSRTPRSLIDTYSPDMASMIREAASGKKFDLIIASQLTMASYYPNFGGIPAVFEEIELGLFLDQVSNNRSLMKRMRSLLTWVKHWQHLSRLLDSFAACTVVSEQEHLHFQKYFPRHIPKVQVIPNCVSLTDFAGIHTSRTPRRIIFAGSFRYQPNYQAMQWFVSQVFPLVLEKLPDVELIITGDHANLPLPSSHNITLAGHVADIKSLVASCEVSLAPLREGGGTRLKILEAMACGTPVVATTKGAEGLMVEPGRHLLVADTPEQFAECILQLLNDKELRDCISANALQRVLDHYEWSRTIPKFLHLVERAASGHG